MSWDCSELQKNVMGILELRSQLVSCPVNESMRTQLTKIRELCKQADKQDILPNGGQLGWRRAAGPSQGRDGQGHGHGHGQGHGHGNGNGNGNRPTGLPNRWRGQTGLRSQQARSSTGSTEKPLQNRYVSKFQNSESPVEDKILNQVILNKLNKFSVSNYDDVKAFLQQILDSDEKDFLRDFMLLVFKKAASEPTFCPLYARMISELSSSYGTLVDELKNLYDKYLTIFEEVTESECKDYEQFVQRNREKLHRLGYSQFLAELTSRGVLTQDQLQKLYDTVLQQIKKLSSQVEGKTQLVDEYADCLLRMSKAFQGTKNPELVKVRSGLGGLCDPLITEILSHKTTLYPGLSKKSCFTLMDCLDIFRSTK